MSQDDKCAITFDVLSNIIDYLHKNLNRYDETKSHNNTSIERC